MMGVAPPPPLAAPISGNVDEDATPIIAGAGYQHHDETTTSLESNPPPELPLTPQSNNKGALSAGALDENIVAELNEQMALPMGGDEVQGEAERVEVVPPPPPDVMELKQQHKALQHQPSEKDFHRNMSALSISTAGVSIAGDDGHRTSASFSYDEEDELPDTPKSSLVSNRKRLEDGSIETDATGKSAGVPTVPSKAVDWLPQQNQHDKKGTDSSLSGATSHAVKTGDDVTVTSFTTVTTAGDMGGMVCATAPPPLLVVDETNNFDVSGDIPLPRLSPTPVSSNGNAGIINTTGGGSVPVMPSRVKTGYPTPATRGRTSLRGSVPAMRSPRPPRHMRAVDWCPPSSSSVASMGVASGGASAGRVSSSSAAGGSGAMASDKTAVTARAVRLGDDATVTTFATMTTMGDAGSILEADTEEEASSSDDEAEGSSGPELDGEANEEESMEDVKDGVVDKIPHSKHHRGSSLSGTTNHAVRAADDHSVVTFATMTTAGGMDRASSHVVDKVPSFAPRDHVTSVVTNETVQMGDNQSLATWATANTMGGQLAGNMVDHVPSGTDDDTVGTSNAVNEDPSVTTFATLANSGVSAINEVVDKIPTFSGGGGTGKSVVSGVTSQVIRPPGDDRSVASFATMTTMGDLGSIYETEVLEYHHNESHHSSDNQDRPSASGIYSNNSYYELDRAVVDVIPEAASSVASGTTNHSVRTGDDSVSVTTFGTMGTLTTAGGRGEPGGREGEENSNRNDHENDVVDKVPNYPNNSGSTRSLVSGTTNRAVRLIDDQSVATWATMTTSGGGVLSGHANEHVVDKTPREDSSMVSDTETNLAQKDEEDQSVVTWNTMTTSVGGGIARPMRSPTPPSAAYAVDRVPSFSNRGATSLSGNTNHGTRAADDQSVVTFATMTSVGGMDRGDRHVVDKVPSFAPRTNSASIVTNDTVQMGDNQSLATWATANTNMQLTGNVVDHVPTSATADEDTVGTSNAIKEDPSITTFTTAATSGNQGINEVVDTIPTFAGGGTGRSVVSGVTNQAVRMGDDRSVASFATMTTAGDLGSVYTDGNLDNPGRIYTPGRRSYSGTSILVDRIPSSADMGSASSSIVSGRTENAVRLGDDLTVTTVATALTEQTGGNNGDDLRGAVSSDQSTSGGSRNFLMAPPTAGILRESRLSRPTPSSALRDGPNREYRTSNSDSAVVVPESAADLPINVGESVSNTHILRAISDLRFHVDYRMGEMRELNRRDSERVSQIVQQEQAKRTALETRLHSQLLLQSESMVAMELKLLRLEAKVANRDSRRQRRQPNVVNATGSANPPPTAMITDRLRPIAATSSTPNRSDEEADSFEELELTPRGTNRHGQGGGIGSGSPPAVRMMHRGGVGPHGGPANIAVVTRSGASVASAVTATSFQEGEFSHALNEDERSDDGDIEDEGDHNDDGSASTPTQSSRNRISNLESILLNPIQAQEHAGGIDGPGISTRAVRGDMDGMSSLPTSVTSTTMASTVVTSTTRGGESLAGGNVSRRALEDEVPREQGTDAIAVGEETDVLAGLVPAHDSHLRSTSAEEFDMSIAEEGGAGGHTPSELHRPPRSRSQSPLTVQSAATGTLSVASASLGPSILSTAAVAPSRSFGTRRANAAAAIANAEVLSGGSRSMANRVVSFTNNDLALASAQSSIMAGAGGLPSPQLQENDGGGDSITMPDELDNFSDIADAFSNSARAWREEYEARLDAINKRLGN